MTPNFALQESMRDKIIFDYANNEPQIFLCKKRKKVNCYFFWAFIF